MSAAHMNGVTKPEALQDHLARLMGMIREYPAWGKLGVIQLVDGRFQHRQRISRSVINRFRHNVLAVTD